MSADDALLRVATANCLHGMDVRHGSPPPADEVSLSSLAACLAALDADVIALQEIDRGLGRSGGIDQVAWLADRLSMHGVFGPALTGDPDQAWVPAPPHDPGGEAYGVGILSRRPIIRVQRRRLPGGGPGARPPSKSGTIRPGWDYEPRVALRADISILRGTVAVTTTHLSYLPWRGLRQLTAAVRLAEEPVGQQALPAIFLGDMNLARWAVRGWLGVRSRRAWRHLGGGPTHPADDPRLQLDHVLTAGPFEVVDVATNPLLTSDHRPVVATLRVLGTGGH